MNDEIKAGDLITSYWKGYYIFIEFEDRGEGMAPLARFQKFANSDGKICKSKKILVCDASYCRLAREYIKEDIEKKKREIIELEKLI